MRTLIMHEEGVAENINLCYNFNFAIDETFNLINSYRYVNSWTANNIAIVSDLWIPLSSRTSRDKKQ